MRFSVVGVGLTCALVLAARRSALATEPQLQLPGAEAFDAELQQRLREAWRAQAAAAAPQAANTKHSEAPAYLNRLIFASSPYLQQHASNPVNWYPWGEEAFTAAQRGGKPIFLSIGYASCHWCHVMEHECFENADIARLLNEHFIAIKVDREERPDIDNVYVAAVQRMTGSAGWPLTVFLTPDRKPFFGGTYFPPDDRFGKPGLPKLLTTLAEAWTTKRHDVVQASADLTRSLQAAPNSTTANLSVDTLHTAYKQLRQGFDATNGGFGRAPKFPQAHVLQFLLRYGQRTGEAQAQRMVEETLERMARGGIHDQIGGGFHRYSTDAQWQVPHFEKMLYDQAINARAYLEAAQATGKHRFAEVARNIFTYVLRDLRAPNGGFYAAEDADSDGEEGRFYTWTRAEIIAALGAERGPLIADFCGVSEAGVLPGGRSPLSVPVLPAVFAKQRGLKAAEFARILSTMGGPLLEARNRRTRPLRDEKIITAWNGLMIASLAYGSTVLGDPQYATAGAKAADFILSRLQRDGTLLHSFRNGPGATSGFLDDYAFFIWGLTDLYAATLEVRWLREADRLSRDMLRLFTDAGGTLRYRSRDSEALIAEPVDSDDAALPAASSVATLVLLHLGRLTMHDAFDAQARVLLAANSPDLTRAPTAHTQLLMALDFALGPAKEIVVAGAPESAGTKALLATVRRHYLPRSVLALHPPGDGTSEQLMPFLKQQTMINDQPTAYVCEHYVCKLPTTDPQKLESLLADGTTPGAAKQN
jgi:uncharacterized protein